MKQETPLELKFTADDLNALIAKEAATRLGIHGSFGFILTYSRNENGTTEVTANLSDLLTSAQIRDYLTGPIGGGK